MVFLVSVHAPLAIAASSYERVFILQAIKTLIGNLFSTYCSLSHNNISDSGASVLAEALAVNQSLQKLR